MPRVFANGGVIGKTLDFTSALSYGIQYVGGAVTSTSSGTVTINFTSLTGGVGSVLAGDLVIAVIGEADTNDNVLTMTTTGYTKLFDLYQNNTQDSGLGVFYKVMGATPDTSATEGRAPSGGSSIVFAVQVWRGVNTSTPIGASASAGAAGSSLANPPAITTTSPNSRVIAIGAAAHNSSTVTFTQGGDLQNFITVGQSNSEDASLGVGSIIGSISASGTVVDPIAFTASTSGQNSWNAVTLELISKNPFAQTLKNAGLWDTGWRYVPNTL